MSFISVDEVKKQANITTSNYDEELEDYAQAACDIVEEWAGAIEKRTVTEVVGIAGWTGNYDLVLSDRPINAIATLAQYPLASVSYVTADLVVSGNKIHRVDGGTLPGQWTVTYTVGYDDIPTWASLAARIIAAHLWRTQRGGRTAGQDDTGQVAGIGYLVPNQAAAILEPHRKPPGIG